MPAECHCAGEPAASRTVCPVTAGQSCWDTCPRAVPAPRGSEGPKPCSASPGQAGAPRGPLAAGSARQGWSAVPAGTRRERGVAPPAAPERPLPRRLLTGRSPGSPRDVPAAGGAGGRRPRAQGPPPRPQPRQGLRGPALPRLCSALKAAPRPCLCVLAPVRTARSPRAPSRRPARRPGSAAPGAGPAPRQCRRPRRLLWGLPATVSLQAPSPWRHLGPAGRGEASGPVAMATPQACRPR